MSDTCDLCGKTVRDYVILNRWATVCDGFGTMVSVHGPSTAYRWKPRTGDCSGPRLCVPHCVGSWIEAQLVETSVERRKA